MNILFIAHDSLMGGSGRCLYELLDQLKPEDGITPIVLCHNKNSLYTLLKKKGIKTYWCRFGYTGSSSKSRWTFLFWKYVYRNLSNFWAYYFIRSRINIKKIDVIHSNSMIIDFGAFLHRKTGIPLVWHLREFGEKDFGLHSFNSSFPQYLCQNANCIIAVSNILVSEFIKNGGKPNKIQCIYDGVVSSLYEKNCSNKHNDEILKLVMVGRLSKEKGQRLAIEAFHQIKQEYRNLIRLDFYGEGNDEKLLKEKVMKYSLEKNIFFHGFSNSIQKDLITYDVGLNLSQAEGFGRTTVEYMMSGLYVIGANAGATPEILDYGKYGTLVPYGDAKFLAKEIEKIILNKKMYISKAKEGMFFAREHFSIEKNYKKIIDIIKSVKK